MKLSDAIIEGSKGKDQAFGYFGLYDSDQETVLKVCALGAAIVGSKSIPFFDVDNPESRVVANLDTSQWNELLNVFPILDKEIDVRSYPELDQINYLDLRLSTVITELNDSWHWPIDQIGGFVRKIEAQHETE